MDKQVSKQNVQHGYESSQDKNAADAVGYWFAAAAISTFLVAGIIVYRSGNSGFDVKSAPSGSIVSAALVPH